LRNRIFHDFQLSTGTFFLYLPQAATDMDYHAQTENYADPDTGEINFNTFQAIRTTQYLETGLAYIHGKMACSAIS
jgi:hypothetical protein